MAGDEVVSKLMEDLKKKAQEIQEIFNTLKMIKKYDDSIRLPDLANLVSGDKEIEGVLEIRPDLFFGMSQTDAAEKYLRMVGHAAPFDDIFDALDKGGIKFSANGRSNLNMQLTRATRKFAKIGRGNSVSFGLLEFYPERLKRRVVTTAEEQGKEEEESDEPNKEKD